MSFPEMSRDICSEVLGSLKKTYAFKETQGEWLRGGKCPCCGKAELYASAEAPWVVKCGRLNRCGFEAATRDLFPDVFGKWNDRFPPTTQNPNATADAYMSGVRGFAPSRLKGWYRQGFFSHPQGHRATATVVFDIDRQAGLFMERFVETIHIKGKDGEIEERKANFEGSYKGLWWQPPDTTLEEGDIWLVEGCIDAISLQMQGIQAVATLSCTNYPDRRLSDLDPARVTLIWALDSDKAGLSSIRRHVERARKSGFRCRAAIIPSEKKKCDWNDAFLNGCLTEKDIGRYRFHGDLLLAESAQEKGVLIWTRTKATSFAVEFGSRTAWFEMPQDVFAKTLQDIQESGLCDDPRGPEFAAALKSARVREIANCTFKFLYFQQNEQTDESWYYTRIDFPQGKHKIKNTFTGAHVSASSEFKKRLLSIAPGALWTGNTGQLNWIIGRYLDDIKIVDTVDFIGYSRKHTAYIFPTKAVSAGRIYTLNDEDFFEIASTSVKSLNTSINLVLGTRAEYRSNWIELVYTAFGAKGMIAVAWWLGSLFAEQIRAKHKSFPFLEIVGDAGAGKSTLIEFLWKLVGRADYEGFDPNKSTNAARARIFSQVSCLPVSLIESDRGGEDTPRIRQFDWDELKTAYNGRASRATGVRNGGNETKEPPFRAAILISQNAQVNASEAIMQRICHLHFDTSTHTDQSKNAADRIASMPVEAISYFLLQATMAEKTVLDLFDDRAPQYEAQIQALPEVRHVRLAKNHGALMALVDALATIVQIPASWRDETMQALRKAAIERQRAIGADHPLVEDFWDAFDWLGESRLNHARTSDVIAINLNHFQKVAMANNQPIPPLLDLKRVLKTSTSRRFLGVKAVNSGLEGFVGRTVKCWIFDGGRPCE